MGKEPDYLKGASDHRWYFSREILHIEKKKATIINRLLENGTNKSYPDRLHFLAGHISGYLISNFL